MGGCCVTSNGDVVRNTYIYKNLDGRSETKIRLG